MGRIKENREIVKKAKDAGGHYATILLLADISASLAVIADILDRGECEVCHKVWTEKGE